MSKRGLGSMTMVLASAARAAAPPMMVDRAADVFRNSRRASMAVDPKSGHGFASSKPVAMWDSKTLAPIKTIDVEGGPDGLLFDAFNDRVYIFSHRAPNATVIDAKDGSVVGTIDLGGAPEQAV